MCEGRGGYPAPTFHWAAQPPPLEEEGQEEGGRLEEERRVRRGGVAERSVEMEDYSEKESTIPLNRTGKVTITFLICLHHVLHPPPL